VSARDVEADRTAPVWRGMRRDDLADVCRVAGSVHPDLPERREVFEEKFRLFPAGCFALELNGALAGYGISHPWKLYEIPPLDAFLKRLPSPPDCLYLHDVAATPAARGYGAAARLIRRLSGVARKEGLACFALASVGGTDGFWRGMGFEAVSEDRLAGKLESYGPGALYMIKEIGCGRADSSDDASG
jgi:ribosomal protein S18 acetylase RimI-like enzyme